jgi:SAM-dependent methyltransferase
MKDGFLDLPYRLPFTKHYRDFDRGFYRDFRGQLEIMGRWLKAAGCRRTLDIGAMTGGCIEYISGLGIRMDGVQFTDDVKRLASARLRKAGIRSTLWVSAIDADLRVPATEPYDGIVTLGWLNLPHSTAYLKRYLKTVKSLLRPGGVFLFDFFEFKDLVVPEPEAVPLAPGLLYATHAERRGRRRLRRHHYWITGRNRVRHEWSELVDRKAREARALLEGAGFDVVRTRRLDFHYPRNFWMARKGPGVVPAGAFR